MTACNDGAGEDHLRQRELIYFYENSSDTDGIKDDEDLASLSGYNGNNRAQVVLADLNKAPLTTFTRNQKLLVVEAWKHISIYIEKVNFIVNMSLNFKLF